MQLSVSNVNILDLTVLWITYNAVDLIEISQAKNKFKMFTFIRRIKIIESNIRASSPLIAPQISLFGTKYTPQPIKRKKGKAKEKLVSKIATFRDQHLLTDHFF